MIKIKQSQSDYTVECDKQELVFIKNEPTEVIRLLQYIVYSLGLNTDTCEIDIKIKP